FAADDDGTDPSTTLQCLFNLCSRLNLIVSYPHQTRDEVARFDFSSFVAEGKEFTEGLIVLSVCLLPIAGLVIDAPDVKEGVCLDVLVRILRKFQRPAEGIKSLRLVSVSGID